MTDSCPLGRRASSSSSGTGRAGVGGMSGASVPRAASAATACRIPVAISRPAAEAAPDGGEPPAPAAARPATPAA
eukprot:383793-Alexandrium_andersonii.AAC.1